MISHSLLKNCYEAFSRCLTPWKTFCTDHGRIVNICRLYCCQATGRCWPSAPNLRGIKYTNCLNAALVEGRSSQSTGGIRPLATDWTSFLQESVSLRSFSKLWQEEPSSHILEYLPHMYSTVGEPHVIYSPFLYAEDPWFVQDVYRYSALIPYRKYQCWPAESCQTPHWSKKLHELATSNSSCTDEWQTHPSWGPKVTWCNSYKFHIYKRII
jgi:hypothetical protein